MNAPQAVMITGAAGNLGQAVARAFADRGARLALVGRTTESLRGLFGDDGERQALLQADLRDSRQAAAALAAAVERFGRVDVLCNLAGGFRMGEAVHETSDATWDFLMDLNVRSLLNTARAVVRT
jgi:NADP-dependent 3-hydroxy acid dehydrogenase YdfG